MIVIEVENKPVTEKPWQRDGRSGVSRSQTAYAATYDSETGQLKRYPVETRIRLAADQVPYAPGIYVLSPVSVYVGEYDALALAPKLITLDEFTAMIAPALANLKKAA